VASIQAHVSHLRRTLGSGPDPHAAERILVTEGDGYRIAVDDNAVDFRRFERLAREAEVVARDDPQSALEVCARALSLWRDDVLVDLPNYEYFHPMAARLTELRISVEECRVQALLDLGLPNAALPDLDRLVSEHPLRERLHEQRMLALYQLGRQSEALADFRTVWRQLDAELGIPPGPSLQQLNRRILEQDPGLWPERAAPAITRPHPQDDGEVATHPEVPLPPLPPVAPGPRRRGFRRGRAVLATVAGVALVSAVLLGADSGDTKTALVGNTVGAVDASGRVVGTVAAGTAPTAVAYGGDALWVANQADDTVMRVDPHTYAVIQRFDVGHAPSALAATTDDVWVANLGDATVTRINIAANKVVGSPISVGSRPAAVAGGAGGVWVANSGDNTIQRIDSDTDRASPPVDVGDGPDGLLVDGGTMWVANGRDGTVSEVDAATGAQVEGPVHVGSGPRGMVRLGDELWVADELSQSVTRVRVADRLVRPVFVSDGPTSLAVVDGSVWVSERYGGSLARIDPTTERIFRVATGGSPRGAVSVDGRLWVAVAPATTGSHEGGTLTVAAALLPGELPGRIDPAANYEITTTWPERLVYEGLVSLPYAPDEPQTVVPNLAKRIPEPGDGGRSYSFQLRRGIHYSTGAEVVASDFERGLRRAITQGEGGGLYVAVVGAQACLEDERQCELPGVETDDATGRITFRLERPDPDFVYKLTLLVFPTPPGDYDGEDAPSVPGTGPYVVSAFRPGEEFVLTRNPHFTRSWSVAAVPRGAPDVIAWRKVEDPAAAVAAVDAGQADLAALTSIGERHRVLDLIASLSLRRPAQLHATRANGTSFLTLNSSVPPFNDRKARQAVNFAVDRRVLVDLDGGPVAADPSCQLLTPGFTGYRPYCPYSAPPLDGEYHGPDLVTARRLVAESRTLGFEVTVTDITEGPEPRFADYIAGVLESLDYRVTIRRVPNTRDNRQEYYRATSSNQIETGGWFPDYPRPSTYFDPLVGCPVAHQNYPTGFCDPALQQQAEAALALEPADPGRSLRAWAAVHHAVVDQAPLVFGVNVHDVWYASPRVGNFQQGDGYGPLFSQIWVR
jgi:ABC-type transport system substrate-binding protein/DNA-binding SARP family transcriptional activator/DNA-binding beta-propeller fold protein YncE